MVEIQGFYADQFAGVRDTLASSLERGTDIGASVTVYLEGQPVVDIWDVAVASCRDPRGQRPWKRPFRRRGSVGTRVWR
jgi:hypothetical protein